MILGSGIISCTEDLRKLETFCLKKREGSKLEVRGGHEYISCLKKLQEEVELFTIVLESRIGNKWKLKEGRFYQYQEEF